LSVDGSVHMERSRLVCAYFTSAVSTLLDASNFIRMDYALYLCLRER